MSKNFDKKFDEIVKAKISPSRNAVISRTTRQVADPDTGKKKQEKGYLIAQQMEIVEDGETTRVFIKGGSLKLSSLKNVVALRNALNTVLEEEGYQDKCKCKCNESEPAPEKKRRPESAVEEEKPDRPERPVKKPAKQHYVKPEVYNEEPEAQVTKPAPKPRSKRPVEQTEPEEQEDTYSSEGLPDIEEDESDNIQFGEDQPEWEDQAGEYPDDSEDSEEEDYEEDDEEDDQPDEDAADEEDGGWEY